MLRDDSEKQQEERRRQHGEKAEESRKQNLKHARLSVNTGTGS